jgi:regulator of RNase E activity RraA
MRCEVNIFGMLASHDDVIHADFHGAVVIPATAVKQLPDAIELVVRREKLILEMARSPGFNSVKMREVLKRANQIH